MSQPIRIRGREIRLNAVDRVVEFFSPAHAHARLQARAKLAIAGQWLGGRTDRRATKGWKPVSGSADADTLFDLPTLRDRSADLVRNNPLALGAVNTVTTTVVGTGLALSANPDMTILGWTREQAKAWKATTQREFALWASNASEADLTRTMSFYGLQELAFRSAMERGDVFALLPMKPRRGCIYDTRVQLIEADRCCNKDGVNDSDTLAGGIKVIDGEPTEYQFTKRHPGAIGGMAGQEWMTVPAFGTRTGRRNVVHLFDRLRPDQRRGLPYLAPVIEALKQLGDYTEAEITAAVVSGMFTVFVTTEDAAGLDAGGGTAPAAAGSDVKLGPGAIVDLAPGETVNTANPGRPNALFDPFVQAILRQIGVALEIPYELLIKHFTSSYTAARAALLEAWRFFRKRRAWLADMFCQPIYEAWLEEAIARGRIDAPGFFDDPVIRAAYCRAEWIGDAPGMLDETKEVQAARDRIAARLSTHRIETMRLQGLEWNEVNAELGEEYEEARAAGTMLEAPAAPAPQQPGQKQPAPPENGQGKGKPDGSDDDTEGATGDGGDAEGES